MTGAGGMDGILSGFTMRRVRNVDPARAKYPTDDSRGARALLRLEAGYPSGRTWTPLGRPAGRIDPIGALSSEGKDEDLPERHVGTVAIGGNAYRDLLLRHVEPDRAVQIVPRREQAGPVAIGLVAKVRMMDAVHPRSDDKTDEN